MWGQNFQLPSHKYGKNKYVNYVDFQQIDDCILLLIVEFNNNKLKMLEVKWK